MNDRAGYAIRGGEEGKRRLDLLARIMKPGTEDLLGRVGVSAGMRCLDVGCGEDDIDEVVRALAAFTEDPRTIIGLPRVFQVWGRRPAN